MSFNIFLCFDGDGNEALDFYSSVFREKPSGRMSYGDTPGAENGKDANRLLYASLPVAGGSMMLSDCPAGFDYKVGNNATPVVGLSDRAELKRIFDALSAGGVVGMPLGETFFNPYFGMLTDKFGVIWQICMDEEGGS